MSSRCRGQEPPDELDWLVSDALHALVRAAEPSPRVWLEIRAAVMAQPRQRGARLRSAFRAAVGRLSGWLPAGQTNQVLRGMVYGVQFSDAAGVSPRLVWWLDVRTGPFSSDWQTCTIVA
ncbi:MAG: hypothetical protein JXM73_02265 [Anaerolineae bacterium]|nr:hypothetical protein [Anaerolineae bacterium]